MVNFDYGNARLRVMKSRLLSRRQMEGLAEAGSLPALITELAKTAYRKPVEAALARASGMDCISIAIRDDLESTLQKIRGFYSEGAGEVVSIVLRAYDIKNLKAILRGLSRNAALSEILSAVMPAGELTSHILEELARAADPRAAGDLLASMGLPFAQPLLALRARRPGADTLEMELGLEQWYFQETFNFLHQQQADGCMLAALQLDADLNNLLVVLRFAHEPDVRNLLREWLDSESLVPLFVGPGKLPLNLLVRAGGRETVADAVAALSETTYHAPLRAGLKDFEASGRLSEFEKRLNRYRLEWLSHLPGKDPLGIGVVLGYLAMKTNEVSNIRWIAHGLHEGSGANTIRSELVFVP